MGILGFLAPGVIAGATAKAFHRGTEPGARASSGDRRLTFASL
jgi:hypothetical protein